MKKTINKLLLNFGYKIIKKDRNINQTSFQFNKQVSIKPNTIQQIINYDFRITPEDRKYITIGEKCFIQSAIFTFETNKGEIIIGNNVYVGGVHFICRSKIEIEDNVIFSWGITIYDHDSHSVFWEERNNDVIDYYNNYMNKRDLLYNRDWSAIQTKPIRICSKAWIGFDCLILKGVTIGEGAVVGAKSVVTKDVEPWTVVAGNPARVVKRLMEQ